MGGLRFSFGFEKPKGPCTFKERVLEPSYGGRQEPVQKKNNKMVSTRSPSRTDSYSAFYSFGGLDSPSP